MQLADKIIDENRKTISLAQASIREIDRMLHDVPGLDVPVWAVRTQTELCQSLKARRASLLHNVAVASTMIDEADELRTGTA